MPDKLIDFSRAFIFSVGPVNDRLSLLLALANAAPPNRCCRRTTVHGAGVCCAVADGTRMGCGNGRPSSTQQRFVASNVRNGKFEHKA
ncbi:hypothetical protein EJB05_45860, partial [Eragrostis curvula]